MLNLLKTPSVNMSLVIGIAALALLSPACGTNNWRGDMSNNPPNWRGDMSNNPPNWRLDGSNNPPNWRGDGSNNPPNTWPDDQNYNPPQHVDELAPLPESFTSFPRLDDALFPVWDESATFVHQNNPPTSYNYQDFPMSLPQLDVTNINSNILPAHDQEGNFEATLIEPFIDYSGLPVQNSGDNVDRHFQGTLNSQGTLPHYLYNPYMPSQVSGQEFKDFQNPLFASTSGNPQPSSIYSELSSIPRHLSEDLTNPNFGGSSENLQASTLNPDISSLSAQSLGGYERGTFFGDFDELTPSQLPLSEYAGSSGINYPNFQGSLNSQGALPHYIDYSTIPTQASEGYANTNIVGSNATYGSSLQETVLPSIATQTSSGYMNSFDNISIPNQPSESYADQNTGGTAGIYGDSTKQSDFSSSSLQAVGDFVNLNYSSLPFQGSGGYPNISEADTTYRAPQQETAFPPIAAQTSGGYVNYTDQNILGTAGNYRAAEQSDISSIATQTIGDHENLNFGGSPEFLWTSSSHTGSLSIPTQTLGDYANPYFRDSSGNLGSHSGFSSVTATTLEAGSQTGTGDFQEPLQFVLSSENIATSSKGKEKIYSRTSSKRFKSTGPSAHEEQPAPEALQTSISLGQENKSRRDDETKRPSGCYVRVNEMGMWSGVFTTNDSTNDVVYPTDRDYIKVDERVTIKILCLDSKKRRSYIRSSTLKSKTKHSSRYFQCVNGVFLYGQTPSDLRTYECTEDTFPKMRNSETFCETGADGTQLAKFQVGIPIEDNFKVLADFCVDTTDPNNLNVVYVKTELDRKLRGQEVFKNPPTQEIPTYYSTDDNIFGESTLRDFYLPRTIRESLLSQIGVQNFLQLTQFKEDQYYLTPGHLAGRFDFVFAIEQKTSFYWANLKPQWSNLRTNWSKVEIAVSRLAVSRTIPITVYSGTFGTQVYHDLHGRFVHFLHLGTLPLTSYRPTKEFVHPIPELFWKVLTSRDELGRSTCIAIVGHNTPYKVKSFFICPEVKVSWLSTLKSNQPNGYVYTCHCENFKKYITKLPLTNLESYILLE